MNRLYVVLICLILPFYVAAQNQNEKLGLLLNKEWQYSYESAVKLSIKAFDKITPSYCANKRVWKQVQKEKKEYLGYLKDEILNSKVIYNADSVTFTYNKEEITEKWIFDPQENTIFINSKEDSTLIKNQKILTLTEDRYSYINQDGSQIDMIPALKKLDALSFQDINELGVFFGNPNSHTVIVNTQGGPVDELFEEEFTSIIRNSESKDLLYVNVHQEQTQTPELFQNQSISFQQAIDFDKKSVAKLHRVIQHFKKQGKKVYVLGISFGAFMTQELLATYGTDIADGYYIMVGRLNIDSEVWKAFSEGKNGMFIHRENKQSKIKTKKQKLIVEQNMSKLAAGLGHYRYTKKLEHIQDLSKVCYVFGTKDEQVGGLTNEEVEFLESRKAKIITVKDGTHSSAIDEGIKLLKDLKTN